MGLVGESKAAHPPDAVRAAVEVGDGLVVVERREPAELVVLDANVVERVGDLVGCKDKDVGRGFKSQ